MSWLREKLNGKVGNRDEKFIEAMSATEDLTMTARSLREQLEPYKCANDPFVAMMSAQRLAHEYEAPQEDHIYLGPRH